eukprot:COSAG01_NODE_3698_length_5784_cov_5.069129_9_plen_81_part_00
MCAPPAPRRSAPDPARPAGSASHTPEHLNGWLCVQTQPTATQSRVVACASVRAGCSGWRARDRFAHRVAARFALPGAPAA